MTTGKTIQEIEQTKIDSIMNTIAWRTGYYRRNPHRFVKECLGINLKLFQKILLFAMMCNNYFMYIASRGQ